MASAVERAKDRIVWRYAIDTPTGEKPRVLVHAIDGSVFTVDHKLGAARFANALEAGKPPRLGGPQTAQEFSFDNGFSSENAQHLEWKELPAFLYLPEQFGNLGFVAYILAVTVALVLLGFVVKKRAFWAASGMLSGVLVILLVSMQASIYRLRYREARTRAELTGTFLRGEHADTVRKLATSKALRAVLDGNGQE